jgi:hypothetical protein
LPTGESGYRNQKQTGDEKTFHIETFDALETINVGLRRDTFYIELDCEGNNQSGCWI